MPPRSRTSLRLASLRVAIVCATAAMLACVALAGPVAADNPSQGQLLVTGDHLDPGQSFTISGYDIDPLIRLDFAISNGDRVVQLGSATVAGNGMVSAVVTLPTDFPYGYANITGTSVADGIWTTSVLVGARAEGPGAKPADRPIGDQAVGLMMTGLGAALLIVAVVWYWIRRRMETPAND